MIDPTPSSFYREISSSDSCNCKYCMMEAESIRTNKRSIHMHNMKKDIRPKKRQGPPTKKQCCLKQLSQQARFQGRRPGQVKQIVSINPNQNDKKQATPAKNKALQFNKLYFQNQGFDSYHAVSISQREKLMRLSAEGRQLSSWNIPIPQIRVNLKNESLINRNKAKSNYQNLHMCENNLQIIKQGRNKSIEASPSAQKQRSKSGTVGKRSNGNNKY